jgi:Tol biopolymer transport system component
VVTRHRFPLAVAATMSALAIAAAAASAQLQLPMAPSPARIAFAAEDDIYTIAADGSDRRRLTTAERGLASGEPAWSPDGETIAFVRGLSDDRSQLWVMRPDGGEQRSYAPPAPHGAHDSQPAWAPDRGTVAFIRRRLGDERIVSALMVTGPDGSGLRTLVRVESSYLTLLAEPSWSPDGQTLLYTRTKLDEESFFRSSLYAVPAAGGTPRRLVADGGHGSWSPDGQRIAFASGRDRNGRRCGGDQCSYAGELYVMNVDGTGLARLTNDAGDEQAPDWSADGERIAFHSDRNYPDGERAELYSIRPDGTCLTWLTNGTARSIDADWQPSGTTDPGECGATAREPLIETETGPAGRAKHPVYWLGAATDGGLLVTTVDAYGREVWIEYSDCSRFDPRDCPPPLAVSSDRSCERSILPDAGYHARDVTRVGDGLLFVQHVEMDTFAQLYAGPTTVDIYPGEHPVGSIVGALRQANGQSEPGRFRRAELPVRFLRRIERAAAARRKYGTARAARRLGISRRALKERAAIHRRLRELGGVGRLACR